MENKTMPWKQSAINVGGQDFPEVDFLLTNVHKDNQLSTIRHFDLDLTDDQIELMSREKTDFLTLTDGDDLKAVMLSPPESEKCVTVFAEKGEQVGRAVASLLVTMYC